MFFESPVSRVVFSVGPEQLLLDPVLVLRDLDVDAGHVPLAAADAPGDDSGQLPQPLPVLAHQRAAAVALAGVLALLAAGAQKPVVQAEVVAEFRPLEQPLAPAKSTYELNQ